MPTSMRRRIVAALPDGAADHLRAARRAAKRLSAPLRPLKPAPTFPARKDAPTRLLVAPANFAGQGWAWAQAAESIGGVASTVMAKEGGKYKFPADYYVSAGHYLHPAWQKAQEQYVVSTFTHVLIEAEQPVLGPRYADDCRGDITHLSQRGLSVALVAHGSDIRIPSHHAERESDSPFNDGGELMRKLEKQATRNAATMADFSGHTFVSTPDLLLDAPGATWLPGVIDPTRWASREPVLERLRPVVVHAPTNPWLKGSEVVDRVMGALADEGVIDYRRLKNVAPDQMPRVIGEADIVIDQLRMGLYGLASIEAMAAGRVVVAYVGDQVRKYVAGHTGLDVPIVEATTKTLSDVMDRVLHDREWARLRAGWGPGFVRTVHDGRRSAKILATWLSERS